MRAALYARYSSERQSERSIDDQIALCRDFVARAGGAVVEVFTDYALTGASTAQRPGLQALMEAAKTGSFDTVVAEALDRLSRDQEDTAALYKRLAHVDVAIETVAEGRVDELHVGLKGTMNALFLKDLAAKIRRGQRGRIAEGRSAGGLSYGYRVVREIGLDGELVRGKRAIDEAQAEVIRRIFREYVDGRSGRAIAKRLNAEGVPAPRGPKWNASTINGNKARRNGILWNELYAGFLVYNRTTFRRDPDTGKRVPRLNAASDWVVQEVQELRIVEADLWDAAQAVKTRMAAYPAHIRRRPKRLLSGLVKCGICGGGYVVTKTDRYGCSAHREAGTCANNRSVPVPKLEAVVLEGLRERLLDPEVTADYVREFNAYQQHGAKAARKARRRAQQRVAELDRQIDALLNEVMAGRGSDALYRQRIAAEDERKALMAEIAAVDEAQVIDLHPTMLDNYRAQISELRDSLTADPEAAHEFGQLIRLLIDRITVTPQDDGNHEIELKGRLAAILDLMQNKQRNGMRLVVAGEGLEPPTRGL